MRALQKQVQGHAMLMPTTDVAIVLDTFDKVYGKENRGDEYGSYSGGIIYHLHGIHCSATAAGSQVGLCK
jgi:hypothetical protein